ncbi:ferric iron uptake transcriptional regulator [Spongiibacter taiwanensis]|uniref:ferric iron uptake transcriptional regulator n=1 Tax=Spongiibacter taiwanensis TaxID=1748242 RepID=UPI002034E153|nr:ferric iron uptake transcriptional regulator [Spongiibacter taiwanensis]USA43729.1 ferric iron uptake transcriptional regulator [Spongiibacter taiwanensis]
MSTETQDIREAGLKVTLPRVKILQLMESAAEAGDHLSAEDVYRRLLEGGEDIGLATVYRVLTQFEAAGLVMRHNFEGGHSVFEMAGTEHHDHMVCLDDNSIVEFHDPVIEAQQKKVADKYGFELVDHSLVLYVRKID